MATCDDLDKSSSNEDEEEADDDETNLYPMASLPLDTEEEDEVTTSQFLELREAFNELLRDSSILYTEYKALKKRFLNAFKWFWKIDLRKSSTQ